MSLETIRRNGEYKWVTKVIHRMIYGSGANDNFANSLINDRGGDVKHTTCISRTGYYPVLLMQVVCFISPPLSLIRLLARYSGTDSVSTLVKLKRSSYQNSSYIHRKAGIEQPGCGL